MSAHISSHLPSVSQSNITSFLYLLLLHHVVDGCCLLEEGSLSSDMQPVLHNFPSDCLKGFQTLCYGVRRPDVQLSNSTAENPAEHRWQFGRPQLLETFDLFMNLGGILQGRFV